MAFKPIWKLLENAFIHLKFLIEMLKQVLIYILELIFDVNFISYVVIPMAFKPIWKLFDNAFMLSMQCY